MIFAKKAQKAPLIGWDGGGFSQESLQTFSIDWSEVYHFKNVFTS